MKTREAVDKYMEFASDQIYQKEGVQFDETALVFVR
jgi:hypothetical protein